MFCFGDDSCILWKFVRFRMKLLFLVTSVFYSSCCHDKRPLRYQRWQHRLYSIGRIIFHEWDKKRKKSLTVPGIWRTVSTKRHIYISFCFGCAVKTTGASKKEMIIQSLSSSPVGAYLHMTVLTWVATMRTTLPLSSPPPPRHKRHD